MSFYKLNKELLNDFIDYLNKQHKENRNVFRGCADIQIIDKEQLIDDFLKGDGYEK